MDTLNMEANNQLQCNLIKQYNRSRQDGASRITVSCFYGVTMKTIQDVNSLLQIFLENASPKDYEEITTWNLVNMQFSEEFYNIDDTLEWLADKMGLNYNGGRFGLCRLDGIEQFPYVGIETKNYDVHEIIATMAIKGSESLLVPPTQEQITLMRSKLGVQWADKAITVFRVNGCMCCS